jgi:hypothetical protein
MAGTLFQRTTDDGDVGRRHFGGDRRRPEASGSDGPRAAWPLVGTIAATELVMLSAVVVASHAVDVGALAASASSIRLVAPAVLGGLLLAGIRTRPAPSAAGRSAPTGGTDRAGREPPAGRRFAAGSASRPSNQAWTEPIA